jgi:hypothetical protein
MVRFTHLLLAVVAAVALSSVAVLGQEAAEPTVDCDALMAELPDCAEMVYTICTDGTPATCGAAVSAQQVEGPGGGASSNSTTNGTAVVESPCEKYVCFENGTYASMEDDADTVPSVEDDAAEEGGGNGTTTEGNGTASMEDDNQGASMEDDSAGNATGANGSSGAAAAGVGGVSVPALLALAAAALTGLSALAM